VHTKFPAPIGKGWVAELSKKYIARWNAYTIVDGVKKKVTHGPHELGLKASHGPGLRSLAAAQKLWDAARPAVYAAYYGLPKPGAEAKRQSKTVADFITKRV
jgi:hypothetical protein